MALGADLFLQGSPSARVATGAGKSPDTGAVADKAESGSFAELYARERETSSAPAAAKPAEAVQEATRRPAREQRWLAAPGREWPAELPPEDVQREPVMLFGRAPSVRPVPAPADPATAASDKAAQATHDSLLADAE